MSSFSPQDHTLKVQSLFERIAGVYDIMNRLFSLGFDALWRKQLSQAASPLQVTGTGVILDLAAGTLEVTMDLTKRYPSHTVLAMDICQPMLARGLPKLRRLSDQRSFPLTGDGRCLPLKDASVDSITIAFGLRNIRPREKAYAEVLRVLAPGGKFCVLEFGSAQDRILFGVYNFYLAKVLPFIGRLVSKDPEAYQYLADTVFAFPSAAELKKEMEQAGFTGVTHKRLTAGITCLYTGKKVIE